VHCGQLEKIVAQQLFIVGFPLGGRVLIEEIDGEDVLVSLGQESGLGIGFGDEVVASREALVFVELIRVGFGFLGTARHDEDHGRQDDEGFELLASVGVCVRVGQNPSSLLELPAGAAFHVTSEKRFRPPGAGIAHGRGFAAAH